MDKRRKKEGRVMDACITTKRQVCKHTHTHVLSAKASGFTPASQRLTRMASVCLSRPVFRMEETSCMAVVCVCVVCKSCE